MWTITTKGSDISKEEKGNKERTLLKKHHDNEILAPQMGLTEPDNGEDNNDRVEQNKYYTIKKI